MTTHIAVLSNPAAGRGSAEHAASLAIAALRQAGADVRHLSGASADETRELAVLALRGAPSALVVVGGDGTLAGVIDAAISADVPLVLVPAGTGNDLARALGIPLGDTAAAARAALTGRSCVIDVGEVRSRAGTRRFLTVAALGFDAKVSARTDRLRWPRGVLRYHLALLIEVVRLRTMDYRVSVDDAEVRAEPGALIAVGNTGSYGGGMPICDGALPHDGLLDVIHVAPIGRLRLLRLLPALLAGRHLDLPIVSRRRVRAIRVSEPDLVVYADGERVAEGCCTIAIADEGLTLLVPQVGGPADADRSAPS